ncbi:MAG: transposase [Candidatus Omnitrophica bacterium]|nr:transposase [Candidatus Omnitrophota bacterium]
MERAQCHTIRERLFKIGALVRVSVRRVLVLMASGYPYERIFQQVYWNLHASHPWRC